MTETNLTNMLRVFQKVIIIYRVKTKEYLITLNKLPGVGVKTYNLNEKCIFFPFQLTEST